MKDPVEKDEVYFALKFNDLMEIGGHYTYYEKKSMYAELYDLKSKKKMGHFPRRLWRTELQRTFVIWLESGGTAREGEGQEV